MSYPVNREKNDAENNTLYDIVASNNKHKCETGNFLQ